MRNLSYENEFCMQFHFHVNQSRFHKNGFALRLALKKRHKGTRKWPIAICCFLQKSRTTDPEWLPDMATTQAECMYHDALFFILQKIHYFVLKFGIILKISNRLKG